MRLLVFGENESALSVAREAADSGDDVRCIVSEGPMLERFHEHVDGMVIMGSETSLIDCIDEGMWSPDSVAALYAAEERNVVVSRLAKRIVPDARIVALATNPGVRFMLENHVGVTVVSPVAMISGAVRRVSRFSGLLSAMTMHGADANIFELSIESQNPNVGKTLAEIGLPPGAVVSCVVRAGHIIVPRGDLELGAGDELILLAKMGCSEKAIQHLTGLP